MTHTVQCLHGYSLRSVMLRCDVYVGYLHQVRSYGRSISSTNHFAPSPDLNFTDCVSASPSNVDYLPLNQVQFMWSYVNGQLVSTCDVTVTSTVCIQSVRQPPPSPCDKNPSTRLNYRQHLTVVTATLVFTFLPARYHSIASYASAGIARVLMSVRLSVCHSPVLYQNEES